MYIIIDQIKNGDCFDHAVTADTEEQAISMARDEWDHLSAYDKNRRECFYLAAGKLTDDDAPDYETLTIIKNFK